MAGLAEGERGPARPRPVIPIVRWGEGRVPGRQVGSQVGLRKVKGFLVCRVQALHRWCRGDMYWSVGLLYARVFLHGPTAWVTPPWGPPGLLLPQPRPSGRQ